MKIALIGVTGRVGSRLLDEMLRRGHEVTGIARHVEKGAPRTHLSHWRRPTSMTHCSSRRCCKDMT